MERKTKAAAGKAKGSFESRLIHSMEQAVAIAKGDAKPAQKYTRTRTARETVVKEAPRYGKLEIVKIRDSMGVSQSVFADVLNVSLGTVRSWEQGARTPDGSSLRLLEVAAKHPHVILETIASPVKHRAGDTPIRERRVADRRGGRG